ncbi:LA_2272 family surface repeat-containing protein [Ferruginibacter sp.]
MRKISCYHCLFIALLIFTGAIKSIAQTDTSWVLKFKKNRHVFNPGKDDYLPGNKGFYLYENCVYDLVLKNDMVYSALILSIKKDSIVFTDYVSREELAKGHQRPDTLSIAASAIKKIRLLGDRIFGLYSSVHLRNYRHEFYKDSAAKRIPIRISTDTVEFVRYTATPYVTAQGIDMLFDIVDTLPGKKIVPDLPKNPVVAKQDTVLRKRNFAWFLPFNAHEINGLALGLQTCNINGKPVTIRGVNINGDVLSMYITMFSFFHVLDAANVNLLNNVPDTGGLATIQGLGISYGGIADGKDLSGVFINGGVCYSNRVSGIVITGGFNYLNRVKGLAIGGIRNNAIKCTGLQIGLINSCKYLKGLQIGLWNVNSKRKLPLINWGT